MAVQRKLDSDSHLYLIDGSGYIFRAYHALPPLTRSDGTPVGAVQGFCNMLWKLLEDLKGEDQPSHLAVIFDHSGKSFRNDLYDQYKANRPPAPEDLVPQFPLIRDATRAFGVPCIELENYEADDLIATYTRQAREAGARVTIVSSDKDLMQLIEDGQVTLFDTMKNKRIDSEGVREKFGVTPDKVIEVQALIGDSVDNVPGVPGIGPKTAAELIETYGDLENLLAHAEEIKQPKRRENLIEHAEAARMSKTLVILKQDCELPEAMDAFGTADPDAETLTGFLGRTAAVVLTQARDVRLREVLFRAFDAPGAGEIICGYARVTAVTGTVRTLGEDGQELRQRLIDALALVSLGDDVVTRWARDRLMHVSDDSENVRYLLNDLLAKLGQPKVTGTPVPRETPPPEPDAGAAAEVAPDAGAAAEVAPDAGAEEPAPDAVPDAPSAKATQNSPTDGAPAP